MIRGYPEGVPAFDVDAFIEGKRDFFEKWMLFETIKPKCRKYTCTHCGYTFEHDAKAFRDIDTPHDMYWDRVGVNDRVCCPKCNRVAYVKNRKTFTPPFAQRAFAIFIPAAEDDVWVRCIMLYKDYTKSDTKVFTKETEIYHLQPGKSEMWGLYDGWGLGERFEHRSRIVEPFSYNHGFWSEKYTYTAEWIERDGRRGIGDTFLRYCAWDKYAARFQYTMPLLKYLCAYARFPQIEVLCKVGVFDAVNELVEYGKENKRVMDWTAKTPWAMHRLTKPEYKVWTSGAYHCDLQILKLYKRIRGKSERDFETAKMLLGAVGGLGDAERMIVLARRASRSPREIVRYFERIKDENNEKACRWGLVTTNRVYHQWRDFMDMLHELKEDDKANPFPRDLKKAHDALVLRLDQKRKEEHDREIDKKFADVTAIYAKIAEKYAYENGKYAVVVPRNAAEVLRDAEKLLLCTAMSERGMMRYFGRIRRNETYILFLRRVSEIEKPWYALEIEPGGTIRQKRSKGDEQYADLQEAEPFLREWQEVIAKRMTGEDLAAAMEARRMRITEMEELARTGTTVKFGSLRGKKLYDVLSADLMEQVYAAKTGGEITEAVEREEKTS